MVSKIVIFKLYLCLRWFCLLQIVLTLWLKPWCVTVQMKASGHNFYMMLFVSELGINNEIIFSSKDTQKSKEISDECIFPQSCTLHVYQHGDNMCLYFVNEIHFSALQLHQTVMCQH